MSSGNLGGDGGLADLRARVMARAQAKPAAKAPAKPAGKIAPKVGQSTIKRGFERGQASLSPQQKKLCEELGLDALLTLSKNSHVKVQGAAFSVIDSIRVVDGKVSVEGETGVRPLVELSKFLEEDVQRLAVWALAILASHPGCQDQIEREVGWHNMRRYSQSQSAEMLAATAILLGNLALSEKLEETVMTKGMPILMGMLRDARDPKVRKAVITALSNVSTIEEYGAAEAWLGEGMPLVLEAFMQDADGTLRSGALNVLANLSTHDAPDGDKLRMRMVQLGALDKLVPLLSADNETAQKLVPMTLGYLCKVGDCRATVQALGAVKPLVQLLDAHDDDVLLGVCMALRMLADHTGSRDEMKCMHAQEPLKEVVQASKDSHIQREARRVLHKLDPAKYPLVDGDSDSEGEDAQPAPAPAEAPAPPAIVLPVDDSERELKELRASLAELQKQLQQQQASAASEVAALHQQAADANATLQELLRARAEETSRLEAERVQHANAQQHEKDVQAQLEAKRTEQAALEAKRKVLEASAADLHKRKQEAREAASRKLHEAAAELAAQHQAATQRKEQQAQLQQQQQAEEARLAQLRARADAVDTAALQAEVDAAAQELRAARDESQRQQQQAEAELAGRRASAEGQQRELAAAVAKEEAEQAPLQQQRSVASEMIAALHKQVGLLQHEQEQHQQRVAAQRSGSASERAALEAERQKLVDEIAHLRAQLDEQAALVKKLGQQNTLAQDAIRSERARLSDLERSRKEEEARVEREHRRCQDEEVALEKLKQSRAAQEERLTAVRRTREAEEDKLDRERRTREEEELRVQKAKRGMKDDESSIARERRKASQLEDERVRLASDVERAKERLEALRNRSQGSESNTPVSSPSRTSLSFSRSRSRSHSRSRSRSRSRSGDSRSRSTSSSPWASDDNKRRGSSRQRRGRSRTRYSDETSHYSDEPADPVNPAEQLVRMVRAHTKHLMNEDALPALEQFAALPPSEQVARAVNVIPIIVFILYKYPPDEHEEILAIALFLLALLVRNQPGNQAAMRKSRGFEAVLKLLSVYSEILQQRAALALGAYCLNNNTTQGEASAAIPTLVEQMRSANNSPFTKRTVAATLCAVVDNNQVNQNAVRVAGGITAIMEQYKRGSLSPHATYNLIAALVSNNAGMQNAVVGEQPGLVNALVNALDAGPTQAMLVFITNALVELAKKNARVTGVVYSAGAVGRLVPLLSNSAPDQTVINSLYLLWAIASLRKVDAKMRMEFTKSRVVEATIPHTESRNTRVKNVAVSLLAAVEKLKNEN